MKALFVSLTVIAVLGAPSWRPVMAQRRAKMVEGKVVAVDPSGRRASPR